MSEGCNGITLNAIRDLFFKFDRKGKFDLLDHMYDIGFFEAPCSGQYHLAEPGGLAEHSLNVYKMMDLLNKVVTDSYGTEGLFPQETIIIVSILHDLGKCGQFGKPNYTENRLKNGELSSSKPYQTNPDLLYVPHEIRSIQIASRFIELTEQESFAILQHNGMYGELKYSLQGKETPLQMLLHFADMWASRVIENV